MQGALSFDPNSQAVRRLADQDETLGCLMARAGCISVTLRGDPFESLARSIVGQQLSVRSASAIWQKTVLAAGKVTPEVFALLEDDEYRAAGISRPKVAYLRDLSRKVASGELDLTAVSRLDEEEMLRELTRVKGIGVWTAQMFMIFCLGRLDVLAPKDLGLQRGARWLYGLSEMPSEAEFLRLGEKWRPFRTVASLYLWEAVTRGWVKENRR